MPHIIYLYILNNAANTSKTIINPIKNGPNRPTNIANIRSGKNTANRKYLYFNAKYNNITKIMNVILIPPKYFIFNIDFYSYSYC